MPLDRTNTDFRGLEERLNTAFTRSDFDRFERHYLEDMRRVAMMVENQGTKLADNIVQLRTLQERYTMFSEKLPDRLRDLDEHDNVISRRIESVERETSKWKWLALGGFGVATFIGAIAFKAIEFWLGHK